jgi:hypothetical protein
VRWYCVFILSLFHGLEVDLTGAATVP